MSNEETNSHDVARLLERTAAHASKMQEDEIISAFDEAEVLCLSMVSSEEEKLEIKRRVAEWKMRLLCDRNAPFRKVELLHKKVVELGYTNLEIEGSIEIYFAKYCERQGRTDDASSILRQLCIKLSSALRTENLEVYRHFLKVCKDILSRTETSGP